MQAFSPPNGLIYNIPIRHVQSLTSLTSLREIIINETLKFNNASNIEDRKLGYTYFLIGLGSVSQACYQSHQHWLAYI